MSDEDKKRIISQPPPPTDEVDGEWGDDDDKTLVRELPESVTKSQPAPSAAAVAGTAVAPISVPAKAAEASTPPEIKAATPVVPEPVPLADSRAEEDDDEEDDDDHAEEEADDEDEDEDEDDADEHDARIQPAVVASKDWIPEWAPFAVLALLVSVSIIFGLGLLSGSSEAPEQQGDAADAQKPAMKPSTRP